jgi:hypothetical protein
MTLRDGRHPDAAGLVAESVARIGRRHETLVHSVVRFAAPHSFESSGVLFEGLVDPRIAHSVLKMAASELKIRISDPRITSRVFRIRSCIFRITSSDPKYQSPRKITE